MTDYHRCEECLDSRHIEEMSWCKECDIYYCDWCIKVDETLLTPIAGIGKLCNRCNPYTDKRINDFNNNDMVRFALKKLKITEYDFLEAYKKSIGFYTTKKECSECKFTECCSLFENKKMTEEEWSYKPVLTRGHCCICSSAKKNNFCKECTDALYNVFKEMGLPKDIVHLIIESY